MLQDIFFWDLPHAYDSDVVLLFNEIPVKLDWKYDIAIIIEQIVDELMMPLITKPSGHVTIGWVSDTFRTDWELDWQNGHLQLRTHWGRVGVGPERQRLEALLNERSSLTIDVQSFLDEWRKLLWAMVPFVKQAAPDVTRFDMWSRLVSAAGTAPHSNS